MGLKRIIKLYNLGRNSDTLREINEISEPNVEVQGIQALTLVRLGKYNEAFELADKIKRLARVSEPTEKFIALSAKVRTIGVNGRSDWVTARKIVLEAEEIYQKLSQAQQAKLRRWLPELLYDKSNLQMMGDGNPQLAILILLEAEKQFGEIENIRDLGFVRTQLAFNKFLNGELNTSIKALDENLSYAEENELNLLKIYVLGFKCEIYNLIGKVSSAIQAGIEALKISKSSNLEFTMESSWSRRNLAWAYTTHGEYEHAITEFTKALTIAKKIGDLHVYGSSLFYLADVNRRTGDLDKAIQRFQKSVEILEKIEDLNCLINANLRWGKTLMSKNDYVGALKPLQTALNIRGWKEENGEKIPLSLYAYTEVLLELIVTSNEIGANDDAETYKHLLKSFVSTHKTKKFSFQLELAKAILESSSRRAKFKIQAQTRLEKLVSQNIEDDELNIRAIINYCELLLEELQNYGEEEVLDEIIMLSKKISKIGERQNSYPLKVESLILEGQLRLIQGDAELSMDNFNDAIKIANEHNLDRYEQKAQSQIEVLEAEMDKWGDMYHKNLSLIDRIDKSRIIEYINEAIKMRDFLPE
ncbi:MAG: tetratricopeptide repeat protein [Candidatus Kariarchaeaceae archaeon]|jgi:tetratricopeptide (TPR) repeat protein